MLLIDMLADVLGNEPTEIELWRASTRGKDSVNLALGLVERYREHLPEPVPARTPGSFRPAFLVDYAGRSNTPYDREFAFVSRALGYADQVAVADEIARWDVLPDLEAWLRSNQYQGFGECDNTTWSLRRIARYGILERAQLLQYVDAPDYQNVSHSRPSVSPEAVIDLRALVEYRNGWTVDTTTSRSFRDAQVAAELEMWFEQFEIVMRHLDEHHEHIDLYLPDWFAGPELLNWTYRQASPPPWLTSDALHNQGALTTLLTLPAPSAEMMQRLSTNDLLAVRDRDHMAAWRTSARADIQGLGATTTPAERLDAYQSLEAHADNLRAIERKRDGFLDQLSDAVIAGVAVAPAALLSGQDVAGTAAVSASYPTLVVARSLFRWLWGSQQHEPETAGGGPTASSAVRTFLSEPAPRIGPGFHRPPTSWMRTLDGRPVAFDFMDYFGKSS